MKNYLLDTNILIFFLKEKYNVAKKVHEIGIGNCYVSEISLAELRHGDTYSQLKGYFRPSDSERIRKFFKVVTVSKALDRYADEKARLRFIGKPVGLLDLMIGCTAVVNNMTMVTENEKDFESITDIQIENWVNRE